MDVERQNTEKRDAILVSTASGRLILYNPKRPRGRVVFSIGHEITHTFFPNSVTGARFRNICESSSKEANELERLCDLGASELLMPLDQFQTAARGNYSLGNAERLAARFGSSFEATVYRLATAHPALAVAGLLQYRQRKEERLAQKLARQSSLFPGLIKPGVSDPPKYRRQSCYLSEQCSDDFTVRWNKSFDPSSVIYRAARSAGAQTSIEVLPNEAGLSGRIEAVRAPYQRENAHPEHPDVLFLWTAANDV
jgi:Zn-dependent peptidase ImmA (M78 family)